ncbi:hypothetical protein OG365_30920 [Streptomyces sp. NBC_00853]|uniref:hypothetical protein n=1 Tax=Streptomyces sp. NBC_00853 TaxID=2903681 RepID=UPI0038732363|nr:hypothetical protein OG365_30920 [Streptomyces sp. NBC_00853]
MHSSSLDRADLPDARFPYGNLLHTLSSAVLASTDEREATEVLHQLVDGTDGLLTRLAELLDTTADRARAYDLDDGDDDAFYLAKDLADAAVQVRRLGEDLHVAPERMAGLSPPPQSHLRPRAAAPPRPPKSSAPQPRRAP